MKHLLINVLLVFIFIPHPSLAYESTYTGRVAASSIVFYKDNDIFYGMVTFKNKMGDYVSIINASATVTMYYYCKEISPFTTSPDTNVYREEQDITVNTSLFKEITFTDGETVFGMPIFRYDGVPWFTHDMNWYKYDSDIFYDKERFCKKVTLHVNCRGVEAERTVNLKDKGKKLKKRKHKVN